MPVYEYTALDEKGKNLKGIIDADSAVAARQKLRVSAIYPVEVKEASARSKILPDGQRSASSFLRRVKPSDISAMTRQLSILLSAGIPLVSSLEALILQATNPPLKKVMAQIKESVNEGQSLASSLSSHPRIFSQIYLNMVRAGEASGSLDIVLQRLAEFSENQEALRGRFRAAMAYPALMSVVGILVLFFLITFIVPKVTQIFNEMQQTLPLPSIILINTSNFMKSFWWLLILALLAGTVLARQFLKTPKGSYLWDRFKISSPVLGPIHTKMVMARFGRTLGSLLQSGVSLLSALQIVRNVTNNNLIADVIDEALDQIQGGKGLASSLSKSSWFPPVAIQMIAVGEQSGELEKMLNKMADIYEREVESKIMAMTSMMEPAMILFMGLIVGFIVIAILLPIFEMSQMIR